MTAVDINWCLCCNKMSISLFGIINIVKPIPSVGNIEDLLVIIRKCDLDFDINFFYTKTLSLQLLFR